MKYNEKTGLEYKPNLCPDCGEKLGCGFWQNSLYWVMYCPRCDENKWIPKRHSLKKSINKVTELESRTRGLEHFVAHITERLRDLAGVEKKTERYPSPKEGDKYEDISKGTIRIYLDGEWIDYLNLLRKTRALIQTLEEGECH